MASGFNTSALTAWVDAQENLAVKQVYGATTLRNVNIVTGIKGTM